MLLNEFRVQTQDLAECQLVHLVNYIRTAYKQMYVYIELSLSRALK